MYLLIKYTLFLSVMQYCTETECRNNDKDNMLLRFEYFKHKIIIFRKHVTRNRIWIVPSNE